MTRRQEYLAHNMDTKTLESCQKESERLQREYPWTDEDTERHMDYGQYTCWLDLILDVMGRNIEKVRGQYCAQMEE